MESNKEKYRGFNQIVNSIYNEGFEEDKASDKNEQIIDKKVVLEPKFIFDNTKNTISLEIFIGSSKMYKIDKLSEFYDRMAENENYKYGDKLEFVHIKENFKESSIPLLEFMLKYAEIIKYGNTYSNTNYRFGATALSESKIVIDKKALDEVFEILQGHTVLFEKNHKEKKVKLENKNPEVTFYLTKTGKEEYTLSPNIDVLKLEIIEGKKHTYILIENSLYKCNKDFKDTTMKLIYTLRSNFLPKIKLSKEQLPQLFSIIIPTIKNKLIIQEEEKKELKKFFPKKLTSRLYLDFDSKNYLTAQLRFVYDNVEYDPLGQQIKEIIARNILEETQSLNCLRKTGFMLDSKNARFVLTDERKIFTFITEDIHLYMKRFDILATEKFKQKQIIQPKISNISVKIQNNLLEVNLENLNIDKKELKKIIEKYNLKNRYYRLKDGTFLNLKDNENIEFLSKLISGVDADYEELSTGTIRIPINRTMYLNQLLDGLHDTKIEKNNEFKSVVNQLSKENENVTSDTYNSLSNILRDYQKTGVKWLETLDSYNFGGILADDMGLGKTIQILSVLVMYKENVSDNKKKTSIVISPSSLALNWESEAKKFTPQLRTLVIAGTSIEREEQINSIEKYDLVITSYDLLKRDIEHYTQRNYDFKYIIADEAQYLKNSTTQNAIAVKLLNGETRFALTGTPMENSLAELWSIFDFVMPGYLFTYKSFKNTYELPIVREKDEIAIQKLKMLIEPFVLRRTKKEVLKELPDKTVTILKSNMQEEQRNIYLSYLIEAKQEIKDAIDIDGLEKSHMKILAILTRLRQICCHPGVFIENYEGGCSKLDQCMELVRDGINSGHKILLFSGYTSMFPIIEEELKKYKIKYFKLTGATKVTDRLDLVNEFNNNDDVKVFLISLKAGGNGLNLIGADMVIHYDPWWNASAENQATDRAYRIGQKKNVQVYKLITKDSIEEKIYELQKNKSALIDNVLDINTAFINKLSREEIMELFE